MENHREDPLGAAVEALSRLVAACRELGDPFSSSAYREAKKALLAAKNPPLYDEKRLREMEGIGIGPIAKVIVEAATTGRVAKLEKLEQAVSKHRAEAAAAKSDASAASA